jgi:hypothetical protein
VTLARETSREHERPTVLLVLGRGGTGIGFLRRLFGTSVVETPGAVGTSRLVVPERDDAVLDIVGEASYQPWLMAVGGKRTPNGPTSPEQIATLIREPKNRYDHNAIAVQIRGRTIGYLARENAVRYQTVADWMMGRGETIACQARLTGGWDNGRRDQGSIGVVLHLGSPGETLLALLGDGLVVRTDHQWPGWMIAFTRDSRCTISGVALDRESSTLLAQRAGMHVHPRMTKKVQLLVDCDPATEPGNALKAIEYGIPVVAEAEFWNALGLPIEAATTWGQPPAWQRR